MLCCCRYVEEVENALLQRRLKRTEAWDIARRRAVGERYPDKQDNAIREWYTQNDGDISLILNVYFSEKAGEIIKTLENEIEAGNLKWEEHFESAKAQQALELTKLRTRAIKTYYESSEGSIVALLRLTTGVKARRLREAIDGYIRQDELKWTSLYEKTATIIAGVHSLKTERVHLTAYYNFAKGDMTALLALEPRPKATERYFRYLKTQIDLEKLEKYEEFLALYKKKYDSDTQRAAKKYGISPSQLTELRSYFNEHEGDIGLLMESTDPHLREVYIYI